MSKLEQVEDQVKRLSAAEQEALRDWLDNLLEDRLELKDEFKAEIEAGMSKEASPKAVIASIAHESAGRRGNASCSPASPTGVFFSLPPGTQSQIQRKIDELGCNLRGFSHHRMQGVEAFRMRGSGDFRVIYQFNVEKNELILLAVGNRRDVYKTLMN